jgi:CRISPR/Cas system-associated exonuclease Cas4 (RecB family)
MRCIIKLIFSSIILTANIYPEVLYNSSYDLLKLLIEKTGWVNDGEENGFSLSKKLIKNKDLYALRIQKKVAFSPDIIQEILIDVNNYDQFLSKSDNIKSYELNRSNKWVDAYQFIENNIPFLDNREYCFRISKEGLDDSDKISLVHWYLLEKNYYDTSHLVKNNKSIYLNYGAGLWLAEEQIDQSVMISYIIYIDPGGSIPDFLIDKANRVSLVNILEDTIIEANRRIKLKNS